MREKNYRYHECAIVCGDVECYEKYAKSIFELYDIPYFVDTKTSILYHPCIELIRAVLEMVEKIFLMKVYFDFSEPICPGLRKKTLIFWKTMCWRGAFEEPLNGRKNF